jgi:hypothetical protein
VAVADQRYWQARRMQAVAETSSAHQHAPEAFKLQELRLAATGRLSGGLAELLQQQVSASQPNRTQPGTSNIPRPGLSSPKSSAPLARRCSGPCVRRCAADSRVACVAWRVLSQRRNDYYGGGGAASFYPQQHTSVGSRVPQTSGRQYNIYNIYSWAATVGCCEEFFYRTSFLLSALCSFCAVG